MRPTLLAILTLLALPLLATNASPPAPVLDNAVTACMKQINAQAASLAVSRDGQLLYARAYGTSDEAARQPATPDTLFRIASVTKPFTSATINALIRGGKLTPDTKVFPYLNLTPPNNKTPDPRLNDITIEMLLAHKAGWDRATSFDPMFRTRDVEKDLRLDHPATPTDVVRWMLPQPLQFTPGERSAYSNFGYCVLGRVIEKATGKPYFDAVTDLVLAPANITNIKLGHTSSSQRDAHEAYYPVPDTAFSLDVMDAHGALIATAPALCQFMTAYWISGETRKPNQRGQNWLFFGSLPGTTAMALQRPDGVNVAVLLNGRRNDKFEQDDGELKKAIDAAVTQFLSPK